MVIGMLLSALASVATAPDQIAPLSGCADCHFADPKAPRRDHVEGWDRSPHGRARVGCEQCHGGNPRTFDGVLAHVRMIRSIEGTSPVNRRNLPATCGGCHTGALAAFRRSRHFELLQSGQALAPTCSSCHGDVEGRVLSARALASQCDKCHGAKQQAPRVDRAQAVREEYEALTMVRDQLKLARTLIKQVDDKDHRESLEDACRQVEVPLTLAIDAGHQFVYDDLRHDVAIARARLDALLARLVIR
jgi:Cytochrome c554 and c-prime